MLCHLSALLGLFWWPGIVLGPLIVWQIKKNELPEIDPHGKEALQLSINLCDPFILLPELFLVLQRTAFGIGLFWGSPFSFLGWRVWITLLSFYYKSYSYSTRCCCRH